MSRVTEGEPDGALAGAPAHSVDRGHEDIIVVLDSASSTVTWSFETERKVELIGNEGVLLHAKTRREPVSATAAASADATKQKLAMQSGF
jgi:hypothetical protein